MKSVHLALGTILTIAIIFSAIRPGGAWVRKGSNHANTLTYEEARQKSDRAVDSKAERTIRLAERKVASLRVRLHAAQKELVRLRAAQSPAELAKSRKVSPPRTVIITSGVIVFDGDCSDFVVGDKVAVLNTKDERALGDIAYTGEVVDNRPNYMTVHQENIIHGLPGLGQEECLIESTTSPASLYAYLSGMQIEHK